MTRALLWLVLWLWPAMAVAQDAATLVADSLTVTADGILVAEGNVEAFHDGTALTASALTYDRGADRLTIAGPILIREVGGAIIAADAADLDARLRDGILRGARLVLDRRLQLVANRIDRAGGRLTALTGVAATSCQVCGTGPPLWDIRARRVVHDEAARQIHFEGARFRVRGVPVFWLPYLRLPDPTNPRATGLLFPGLVNSTREGLGIRLPYFVALGPTRDLLVTPTLARRARSVELRYRQAFARGEVGLRGALSDDLDARTIRGFALLRGRFDIGSATELTFSGLALSDESYLSDFGQSDADRLESTIALARVAGGSLLEADVTHYRSLRDDEEGGSLPPVVAEIAWSRRVPALGGTATLGAGADAFARTTPGTGEAGRDVARAGVQAGWRRDWITGPGVIAEAEGRLALDAYRVNDDPARGGGLLRATPAAAVTLRWPLRRAGAGHVDLLEPVVSLGLAAALGGSPPNEDGRLLELDEANLHALARLPGEDAEEEGARLSYGLSWTRATPGAALTLTLGQLLRSEALDAPEASGLAGLASDTLLAGRLDLDDGLAVRARALLGPEGFGKSEARLDWAGEAVTASAAYSLLPADLAEDRPRSAAEWTVDTEWRASDRLALSAGGRYDVGNDAPARARVGLVWRNECVEVDVSVSRRYTSSDTIEASTNFGLSINLDGFSAGGGAPAPGPCRR